MTTRWWGCVHTLALCIIYPRACISFLYYITRCLCCPLNTHREQECDWHFLPCHLERWVAFFLWGQIRFLVVWCQYNLPLKAREQYWTTGWQQDSVYSWRLSSQPLPFLPKYKRNHQCSGSWASWLLSTVTLQHCSLKKLQQSWAEITLYPNFKLTSLVQNLLENKHCARYPFHDLRTGDPLFKIMTSLLPRLNSNGMKLICCRSQKFCSDVLFWP